MSTLMIFGILVVWVIIGFSLGIVMGKAIKYARGTEE